MNFDLVIKYFKEGKMNIEDWNFASHYDSYYNTYVAYVMGEGAEQCLAKKSGFKNREEIVELFKSLGVRYVLPGVG